MTTYQIAAALLYSISFLLADSISKKFVLKVGAYRTGIMIMVIGLMPAFASLFFVNTGSISVYPIALSVAAGIILALGYVSFYMSLETEQVANSMAFAELSSLVYVVFGFLIFGESLSSIGVIGVITVFIGAALIATTEKHEFNRKLLPAALAFILWAASFIIYAYAIDSSGTFAVPIMAMKLTSLIAFVIAAQFVRFKKTNHKISAYAKGILSVGILDGLGSVGFGAVVMLSAVGLTGVINSLAPVFAALIGIYFFRERFTKIQLLGFAIIIIGALIVSSL
jgi:drug/metabolite transporter (DMT)-like permease